jgi:hypothetical protein
LFAAFEAETTARQAGLCISAAGEGDIGAAKLDRTLGIRQ